MRIKLIACKVFMREISYMASKSSNIVDITWLRQGYHNAPDTIRQILTEQIERIDSGDDPTSCLAEVGEFDAIALGYGLCSNGIVGVSSKKHKLIIPKAHDCVTLFLGSRGRYDELFGGYEGGAYWYNAGWIENSGIPSQQNAERQRERCVEMYGEENADYLLSMEQGWYNDYKYAVYINSGEYDFPDYSQFTKDAAEYHGWKYNEVDGDFSLLEKLIAGHWDDDFLVLNPGETAEPSHDGEVIKVK